MQCLNPLTAYFAKENDHPSGEKIIVFDETVPSIYRSIYIPCGQCIGCRISKSREWAIRCVNEADLHEHNHFLTLTFQEDQITLDKQDYQLFMKRLRASYYRHYKKELKLKNVKQAQKIKGKIKYYHCGEYGEKLGRPHHHACIFNLELWDLKPWKQTESGMLYTSDYLNDIWQHGYVVVGEVNFDTAAYVARYITKKITGDQAEEHYEYMDEYGELHQKQKEYNSMSLKPAIGLEYIEKYWEDIYPADVVTYKDGKKCRPPRYYDKYIEKNYPDYWQEIKDQREDNYNPESIEREKDKIMNNIIKLKKDYEPKRPFEYSDIKSLPDYDKRLYDYKNNAYYEDKNAESWHDQIHEKKDNCDS